MSESSVATTGTGDPSARMTRIPVPIASPGSCVICGKNEHPDGFAATDNLDFEFYGTVYFCADCVGDYARLFGYLSPGEMVKLREHIEAQDAELNTLRQAVLGLESTVDGLVADAHRRSVGRPTTTGRNGVTSISDGVPEHSLVQPDAGPPNPNLSQPTPVQPVEQPATTEPAGKQGPNDLRNTPTADELLGL